MKRRLLGVGIVSLHFLKHGSRWHTELAVTRGRSFANLLRLPLRSIEGFILRQGAGSLIKFTIAIPAGTES